MQPSKTQSERLDQLERFVRNTKMLLLVCTVAAVVVIVFGKHALASSPDEKILHLRGIVIEDATGHPRMLIGAPVSNKDRKRQDDVTGLVLLEVMEPTDLQSERLTMIRKNGALQHRMRTA